MYYIIPVTDSNAQIYNNINMHLSCEGEVRITEVKNTDTSKNTMTTLKCCDALHSYVETTYLQPCTPPKMEIHPLKMVCGCPCGGVINRHTCSLPAVRLSNAFANVLTIWFLMSSDVIICQCTIHSFTVCILRKRGCISKSVYMCVSFMTLNY